MNNKIYITSAKYLELANNLAQFTKKIQVVDSAPTEFDYYLQLDENGLSVITHKFSPIYINKIYNKLILRTKFSQELLIQAVNLKNKSTKNQKPVLIFDLTAGLGLDGFLLANYGYNVVMIERNSILATILYFMKLNDFLLDKNWNIIYSDSLKYIETYKKEPPEIIYLDPMFKHSKNALAKKHMQLIQFLADDFEENNLLLFQESLKLVTKKLVVKRDNKQVNLVASPLPNYSKLGKTIRYDIYLSGNT